MIHEKVVLIGAGSAMFTRGLMADMIRQGWQGEIGLVDIDPNALDVAARLSRKMVAARNAPLTISASTDRTELLPDATAVICTVGVGGRRAWEQDVFVPRKYGIYQPVGDSVMPGGTSRALRMIPPMVDIARDILRLAPTAVFFNYGNPMSPVCRGIRKATGAPVTGLCHGVHGVAQSIAAELDVSLDQMQYTAVGINHLTWFAEVRVDGVDALDKLRDIARTKLADLPTDGAAPRNAIANAFTWQCVELFGAFPAVYDRHVVEFFPHMFGREHAYFGQTLGVDDYAFELVIARGDEIFAEMSQVARAEGPLSNDYFDQISGEHEQVTDIITSIRNDTRDIYSANLPNAGQVPNLPRDAVIECPCVADAAGLRPISQPALASGLAGTLATRFQWVETVVEAALEGDRDKFVQALLLDGSVDSVQIARKLADDMLAAQAEYLPQFQK